MPTHTSDENIYRSGTLAPVSGIYRVTHLTGHRKPHLAVIIRGEELPNCRTCQAEVRFEVVQMASHVTHDWDFTAPAGLVVRQISTEFANLRSSPRHQVALPLTVGWPVHPDAVRGHTIDVSDGGLCAILEGKLTPEEAFVCLRITVPGLAAPFSTLALLRYRAGNRHGFLFTDLDANTREMVRAMVTGARRIHQ